MVILESSDYSDEPAANEHKIAVEKRKLSIIIISISIIIPGVLLSTIGIWVKIKNKKSKDLYFSYVDPECRYFWLTILNYLPYLNHSFQ